MMETEERIQYKKEWYLNNKERVLDGRKKHYQIHRKEVLERVTQHSILYPERKIAENKARQVKISAEQICEICKIAPATHKHHPNYTNPLEIVFLCGSCHKICHTRGLL